MNKSEKDEFAKSCHCGVARTQQCHFISMPKELPKTEEIPYVMVTQPSRNHTDQKSYAGDVQARQQTALAFRVGDR